MSEENIRLAHEVIDAVEHRELAALLDLTDPAVEWHSAFAIGGYYVGHEGMRQYVKDMNDAWDVVRLAVDHEFCVGPVVIFVGRIQYRGQGSGVEGEAESGYMLKFRDRKLVTFRPFRDPENALENVGLLE